MTPLRNDRGIALVITLLVVAILAITVLEFAFSVHVDAHMGRNALNSLQATLLARSGINLGEALLIQDVERTYDSPYVEDWGKPELLDGQVVLPANMLLKVKVEDEQGKINVNLTRPNWKTECPNIDAKAPGMKYRMWITALGSINGDVAQAVDNYWSTLCARFGSQAPVGSGTTPAANRTPTPGATPSAEGTPQEIDPNQVFVDFPSLDDFAAKLGIPARVLHDLRRSVTALPSAGAPRVNGNTAPPRVLAAIIPQDQSDRVDELTSRRKDAGLTQQDVLQIAGSGQQNQQGQPSTNPSQMLGATSQFFLIRASAIINANPVTGRGGVRRSASMLVQRTLAPGRPGAPAGVTGPGAVPRWTLKQLDWQKEGGAALFTERADEELTGDSGMNPSQSRTTW